MTFTNPVGRGCRRGLGPRLGESARRTNPAAAESQQLAARSSRPGREARRGRGWAGRQARGMRPGSGPGAVRLGRG